MILEVRRYTRKMPGLMELHTLYFHHRMSSAAEGAVQSLRRKLELDPGGKVEILFQKAQVMGVKECWRRAKALAEMLHTCDIGWEKGSKEWVMKRTPSYFIRNAIIFPVVVHT